MKRTCIFLSTAVLLWLTLFTYSIRALGPTQQTSDSSKIKLTGLYGVTASRGNPFSQSKFVPGISFIMDFSYVRRNLEGEEFEALTVPGLIEGHGHSHEGHSHGAANAENGFNLNYGELALKASVDPYFDMFAVFHLSEGSFDIEEAYVNTRSLPWGFRLKLGKFLSGFGRLNEKHAHVWDFVDIPLVYRAFFGDEGLADKGLQLTWLAPADFYLAFGIESLQGTNENSFGIESFDLMDAETEEEIVLKDVPLPNLWTFFGKTSLDLGDDLVLLTGVSYATGKSRLDHFEDEETPHGFAGDTRIFGFDTTLKYIIDSYRYISLQGEYLHRRMKGSRFALHEHDEEDTTEDTDDHSHDALEVESADLLKKQSGWYTQLVFRFNKWWRFGSRWDSLKRNRIFLDDTALPLPENLNRYSFMVDFNPTEFSRIRLQYNINRYAYLDGERKNYNSLVLQFNMAIGAHGAHSF
jgi:hypothetical protein